MAVSILMHYRNYKIYIVVCTCLIDLKVAYKMYLFVVSWITKMALDLYDTPTTNG